MLASALTRARLFSSVPAIFSLGISSFTNNQTRTPQLRDDRPRSNHPASRGIHLPGKIFASLHDLLQSRRVPALHHFGITSNLICTLFTAHDLPPLLAHPAYDPALWIAVPSQRHRKHSRNSPRAILLAHTVRTQSAYDSPSLAVPPLHHSYRRTSSIRSSITLGRWSLDDRSAKHLAKAQTNTCCDGQPGDVSESIACVEQNPSIYTYEARAPFLTSIDSASDSRMTQAPLAMTAAASRSPRSAWKEPASPRTRNKQITTPTGHSVARTPSSATQTVSARHSPRPGSGRSVPSSARASSPSYFGLVPEPGAGSPVDSDAGTYAKGNWKSASSSIASKAAVSPQPVPFDQNPDLVDFRRQSEAYAFNLGNLHRFNSSNTVPTASSPLALRVERSMSDGYFGSDTESSPDLNSSATGFHRTDVDSSLDDSETSPKSIPNITRLHADHSVPLVRSPAPKPRPLVFGEQHQRSSRNENLMNQPPYPSILVSKTPTDSSPQKSYTEGPSLITAEDFAQLYDNESREDLLILDLRVAPQYAKSHVKGSLNLCIPTTLLKRPSFSVPRLSDAFTKVEEKTRFARWNEVKHIIVYDGSSATIRDATSAVNTLRKFVNEGWKGKPSVVRGGFDELVKHFPRMIDSSTQSKAGGLNKKGLKLNAGGITSNGGDLQVAGGCPLPAQKSAANPFFSNIRQNQDLIGGVGQIEIKLPEDANARTFGYLPAWLQRAAAVEDKGKQVADKFLEIERAEQHRMQSALAGDVHYDTPQNSQRSEVQVAGIEKGDKNRYKDILPFDHSRVKLEDVEDGGSDYINASHIKAEWSNRRYISTQAPMPATFEDFWRLVWEQDVRVLVMLTAEKEGNQQKAHPYWIAGEYGPVKVKNISETRVALVPPASAASRLKRAQMGSPLDKPVVTRRRATNPLGLMPALQEAAPTPSPAGETEISQVLVRKLTIQHSQHPFQPIREITQLHFSQWPDFGSIAAQDVLGLVEQCNNVIRVQQTGSSQQKTLLRPPNSVGAPSNPLLPVAEGERPILVHCSAGCGRTGTFCAIDSAVDMLKRQRMAKTRQVVNSGSITNGDMDVDEPDWVFDDTTDLIAKAVEDFRLQRLSMVQTLKQYVLCYEAIIEWWVKHNPDKFRAEHRRGSSQG